MQSCEEEEKFASVSEDSSKTNVEISRPRPDPKRRKNDHAEKLRRILARSAAMADNHAYDAEANKEIAVSTNGSFTPVAYDKAATKRLLRRLDFRLLPYLWLIYMLCFLDRTNVGNAKLFDLEKTLGMHGIDFNVASAILFLPYGLAEVPSNIILKRMRPGIWFLIIMSLWGAITMIQGFVKNYAGLLACRFFLGVFEGGLFPGVCFYITSWYPRNETGFRMALFFSASPVAGAIGGFLARGIGQMDGAAGRGAWSWIFIIEGAITFLFALACPLFVQDYPENAKFLKERDRIEVKRRLTAENELANHFDWKFVGDAFKDWKIYINMLITIGIFIPLYSISLFLPTILKELGHSVNKSQLMTVPVYVIAAAVTIGIGYLADKNRHRGGYMLFFEGLAIVGFLMLVATKNRPNVKYAGAILAAVGIYPLVPLIGAWNSNNIGGSSKRAVGVAMQVGFGNLGGFVSGFIYLPRDQPRFVPGHSILIATTTMSFCLTLFMTLWFRRENARRSKILEEGTFTSEELKIEEEIHGDKAITFRYIL